MKRRLILFSLLFVSQLAAASDPPVAATAQIWETPHIGTSDHPILGAWVYTHNGNTYQREFTREGKCILTRHGHFIWSYRFKIIDARRVDVYSEKSGRLLRHQLQADGQLDIENRYLAKRRSSRSEGRLPRSVPPSQPKTLNTTDLDLRIAFLAAQMSSRAYHHHPDFSNVPETTHWVLRGEVQRRDRFEQLLPQINDPKTDTEVLMARNGNGILFVAFRGTEDGAEGSTDRSTSLKLRKVIHREGCKFHKGYYEAYKSIEKSLDERLHLELARLQRDCRRTSEGAVAPCGTVIFTGHSLGGSLATIAYQRFAEKQQQGLFPNRRVIGVELYSFGSPRAITWMCQRQIWSALDLEAHAILNYNDRLSGFVPSNGRSEDRYVYPDKVYLFDEDRKLHVVSGATHYPDRGASGGHKLKEYRTSLNQAFRRAGWPLEKRPELIDASSLRSLSLMATRSRMTTLCPVDIELAATIEMRHSTGGTGYLTYENGQKSKVFSWWARKDELVTSTVNRRLEGLPGTTTDAWASLTVRWRGTNGRSYSKTSNRAKFSVTCMQRGLRLRSSH